MKRRGAVLMETVLWVPILVLLLMGTVEFTRVAYTYYTLEKILYNLARYAGTQQGINFCDPNDANVLAAKQMAITGNPDGSGESILPNLSADLINIRLERFAPATTNLIECACEASANGCDTTQGAPPPDYIVVSIPDGYNINLRIPGIPGDAIPLRPQVRMPFGGT